MVFDSRGGPFAVGYSDIVLSGVKLPATNNVLASVVDVPARIYYPAKHAGADAPPAEGGPWPGIAFAHGRLYTPIDNIAETNHTRATGVVGNLVSHGYVAVSTNMGIVDQDQSYRLRARARIVNAALRALSGDSVVGGGPVRRLVDSDRLGTLGHSRGGAAAFAANHYPEVDVNVRAVGAISPVQGDDLAAHVPSLQLYGALDDDVSSGDPVLLYERSASPKTLVYLDGASHFHFTDDLTVDMAVLPRVTHHGIAAAYFRAFFDLNLKEDFSGADLVTGAEGPPPETGRVKVQHEGPNVRALYRFELPLDDPANRCRVTGMEMAYGGQDLDLKDMGFFSGGNRGMIVAWGPDSGAEVQVDLDEFAADRSDLLSVRVAQLRALGRVSPMLGDVPFELRIADADGHEGSVRSGDMGFDSTPFASRNPFHQRNRKELFGTLRVPMASLAASNPELDLGRLSSVRFVMPQRMGSLVLDDLVIEPKGGLHA